jgi:hypothetical protein
MFMPLLPLVAERLGKMKFFNPSMFRFYFRSSVARAAERKRMQEDASLRSASNIGKMLVGTISVRFFWLWAA